MGEETIGVSGEFDAEAFNRGLNKYIQSLANAEQVTERTVASFNSLAASTQSLVTAGNSLTGVSRTLTSLARSLSAVGSAQINNQLVPFLNQLSVAGGHLATVAPALTQTSRSLASFTRSLSALGGLTLNAQPLTQFTNELFTALSRFGRFKTVTTTVENLRSAVRSLSQISNLQLNAGNITAFVTGFAPAMLQLSRALRNLSNIPKIPQAALATLSSLGNIFKNFGGAPPNVGPLLSAISRLASLLPKLNNIQQVPQAAIQSFTKLATSLGSLGGIANLNPAISALRRLVPIFQQLATLKPIPANVLSSIQNLSKSLGTLGNSQNITQLSTVLKSLTKATQQLSSAQAQAVPQLERFSSAFREGIGVGVGFGVVQVLQKVGSAIANLGRDALSSIRFFETFTVSVQSAIATQIRFKDSSVSMSSALAMSERPAQALLRALEKLAVFSPFTTEQVGLAFRTATAYGFTAENALNLTRVLVDFTSGAGLTGDELSRIALALSQVSARGKLAGEEVRQLANAGVPIVKILAVALNKTSGEILKMIKDGDILANTTLDNVIKHMKQWEGSGKRLALTFTGLLSSLVDIKQIAFRDFFGGAFAPLKPVLEDLVDFLTSDEFKAGLIVAGELIGRNISAAIELARTAIGGLVQSLRSISPETTQTIITFGLLAAAFVGIVAVIGTVSALVVALVNPFTVLTAAVAGFTALWVTDFNRIASTTAAVIGSVNKILSQVAIDARDWGANIVTSLSAGMAGAIGAITRVLGAIGRVISHFLEPGSPPRLLPELDLWGKQAAEVYLSGWTVADFGALNEFGQMVQQNLQDLSVLGKVKDLDVPALVRSVRLLFSQALNEVKAFGAATEQTLQAIANTSRLAVAAVSGYITRYAAVRTATEAVTEAQTELNAITKAYDDQLKPLSDRLSEINRLQQAAENTKKIARLRRVLANQGITDAKRQSTQLELEELQLTDQIASLTAQKEAAVDAGQAKLTAAQAALTSAQQELDLFNAQNAAMQTGVSLIAEQQRLMDAFAKALEDAAKKIKEGLSEFEKQLKVIQFQQEALQDNIDAEEARFVINDKNSTAAEKYAAMLKLQEIAIKRQLAITEAEKLGIKVDFTEIDKIPIVLEDFRKKLKEGDTLTGDDVIPGLNGGVDELEKALDNFETTLGNVRLSVNDFFDNFAKAAQKINDALPPFLRWKKTAEEEAADQQKWANITSGIDLMQTKFELLDTHSNGAATGVDTFGKALLGLALVIAGERIIASITTIATLLGGINPIVGGISVASGLLAVAWFNDWLGIQETVKHVVSTLDTKMGELVGLQQWVDLKALFSELGTRLKAIFTGEVIPENAVALIQAKVDQINAVLVQIGKGLIVKGTGLTLDEIVGKAGLGGGGEEKPDIGLGGKIGQSLLGGFQSMIDGVKVFWDEHINDSGLIGWIGDIGAKFIELLGGILGNVIEFINGTIGPGIVGAFKAVFVDSVPKAIRFWRLFINGLIVGFPLVWNATKKLLIQQVALALSDVFKVTGSIGKAFVDAGKSVADGFVGGLIGFMEKTGLSKILANQFHTLQEVRKDIGIHSPSTVYHDQVGVPMGEGVTTGFIDAITLHRVEVLTKVGTLLTDIQLRLLVFQTALTGDGGFFPSLNTSIFTLYDEQIEGIKTRLTDMNTALVGDGGFYPKQNQSIFDLYDALKLGVRTKVKDMVDDTLDQLIGPEGLLQEIQTKFSDKGEDLGEDFGNGIAKGIKNSIEAVEKAARKVVTDATAAAKDEMEAKSPSKIADTEVGRPWGQGFAQGILHEVDSVMAATERLTTAALRTMQNRLVSVSSPQSSVAPVTNNSSRVFNLNVTSQQPSRGIVRDFGVMQVLAS